MTLHATFRGGPAHGTDRTYPHITSVLPALWWTRRPSSAGGAAAERLHIPTPRRRTAARRDGTVSRTPARAPFDPYDGAGYRLCCPDPHRDGVWIYTVIDQPPRPSRGHRP